MAEADLYPPIKAFLESQGYEVKGEVGACDIVAMRGDEPPVVVELKDRLTLALVLQAVDRLTLTDTVYVAFRVGKKHSASWRSRKKQVTRLLRRLGIGLLTVSTRGNVVPVLDPTPYKPRISPRRQTRLLKEFNERVGDPEAGGSASAKRMTSYRQDAIRCAGTLVENRELKLSMIREQAGVDRAGNILRDNHYGWFERVRLGHYALTPRGRREWEEWSTALASLEAAAGTPAQTS